MQTDDEVEERLEGIGKGDNSDAGENLIFGPPGTGKTRKLTRQIERAAARFGDDRVIATSFSKATAAEVAGRDVVIERDRIGTLHSYCFHALGEPAIAETHVEEWNKRNPSLRITPVSRQHRLDGEDLTDDGSDLAKPGDRLLQQLNRCRGLMLDSASWPTDVREFAARWKNYKASYQLLDFCDLIEQSSHHVPTAPGDPAVIIADEAQDLNPMQMLLVRKWGRRGEYYILAGDDDQTIYCVGGASPEAILDPEIPEDHKVFLKESVRVPRAVHAVAERLIRQVSRRQEKTYRARPADGEVVRLSRAGYRSPEYWILKTAERHLAQGKTIMFLASCSYMVRPIVTVLRKYGIPFHNPHRKSNGFWNPLRTAQSRVCRQPDASVTGRPPWIRRREPYGGDLAIWRLWTEWLRGEWSSHAWRGGVHFGESSPSGGFPRVLETVFAPDALAKLLVSLGDSPVHSWTGGEIV